MATTQIDTHTAACALPDHAGGDCRPADPRRIWDQPPGYLIDEARDTLGDEAPWCVVRELAWKLAMVQSGSDEARETLGDEWHSLRDVALALALVDYEGECSRCRVANPAADVGGSPPASWEVLTNGNGHVVGLICEGCITAAERERQVAR